MNDQPGQRFWKSIQVLVFIICMAIFVSYAFAAERFHAGKGTVTDTKTGLMWAAKDNGLPLHWKDARAYCKNYTGGDYTDWRMPTLDELASLYDPEVTNKNGYHLTVLIETTAQSIWSSERRGFDAGRFNFTYGKIYWLRHTFQGAGRVLPVRNTQ